MAGLKEDNTPFISAFDLIGAPVITDDFVVGGTCTNNLYGMCESFYRPDMVRGEKQSTRNSRVCEYVEYCVEPHVARLVSCRHFS